MQSELKQIFTEHMLDNDAFINASFGGRKTIKDASDWKKVEIKLVEIKGEILYQFNYFDAKKCFTKNYAKHEAISKLGEIADCDFRSIFIRNKSEAIQVQINKKGKINLHHHKEETSKEVDLSHDKKKSRIIDIDNSVPYLQMLGLSDVNGNIKPTMQDKYKQINEFIKLLDNIENWENRSQGVSVIDCGSGSAYLTFATYHYFKNILGKDTKVVGIDIKDDLTIKNTQIAKELGWDNISFATSYFIDYEASDKPTISIALHACDTATDEALMKAINWGSEFILSVPCCHHNLQEKLSKAPVDKSFAGVMSHGILSERMGDILTDSMRAMILEIMGYKTDVIQYVSMDHTAKNLMIRAKKVSNKPLKASLDNYKNIKNFWKVIPHLEELLKASNPDFAKLVS